MTIAAAATLYDTTPRTLHRWKEIGEEKGLPCPLARPAEMPDWWAKCMERRCPSGVLTAAAAASLPETSLEPGVTNQPELPVRESAPSTPFANPDPAEIGYGQTVERLRKAEATLGGAYQKAVEAGEMDKAARLRREWNELSEELRKAEVAFLEMTKRARLLGPDEDLIPKSRVCAILDDIHGRIPRNLIFNLTACIGDARRALGSTDPETAWRLFSEYFVKKALSRLTQTKFADELQHAEGIRSQPAA